jgi:DNA-binding NarL/FixJ family response regulator
MTTNDGPLILVVDDNQFNREGLADYLRTAGYATCEAGGADTALAAMTSCRPDGAVVDIVIPRHDGDRADTSENIGMELVAELKAAQPRMGIVVFSAYDDRGSDVWEMVRQGTRGLAYMLKGNRPERVLAALHEALAGNVVLDPKALTNTRRLADELIQQMSAQERPWIERAARLLPTLTDREMEVARELAYSQNLAGIAEALDINQRTVENHITSVYSTLQLSDADKQVPALRKSTLLAKAFMLYALTGAEGSAP